MVFSNDQPPLIRVNFFLSTVQSRAIALASILCYHKQDARDLPLLRAAEKYEHLRSQSQEWTHG